MANLVAKNPCAGLLPITAGMVALSEVDPGTITSLAPLRGKAEAGSAALHVAHGMAYPAPGRATGKAGARAVWAGLDQAFLIGPAPDPGLEAHYALTDQSDGWAALRLEGPGAEAVLARLCPLDLRPSVFKRGHTARSLLGHMNASVTRTGAQAFDILVFRSMARSAVHELGEAMRSVAARG